MKSYRVSRLLRLNYLALVILAVSLLSSASICYATTAPKLSLSPANWTPVTVAQGSEWSTVFTVTGNSTYQGNVTLTVVGLPSGVTASWSQDPLSLTSETGTSTLTLTAGATTPVGTTGFMVMASGDGVSVTNSYNVQVVLAPGVKVTGSHQGLSMYSMATDTVVVTATPVGGVTVPAGASGASAAVVSGLPTGIAASWSSPTVTQAGAVSWTLTLTGSVYAVASSTTLGLSAQITDANSGNVYASSLPMPLTVSFSAPTLNFSQATTNLPVIQGGQISDLFTFTGGGSFHGNLTLTVSGLPNSVSYSWSNPVSLSDNSGSSTLTLTPNATSTVQDDLFTVTASGDGLNVSKSYTLKVKPSSGVQALSSSSTVAIEPNGTATLSVTADPINGIVVPTGATGASAAIVSTLPPGVTAAWSSPTLTSGSVVWTLTLTGDSTVQTGSWPVNLAVQITDANTGLVYAANSSFTLLESLLANVIIGSTPGISIPANFLGLSQEWNAAQTEMGDTALGVNAAYRQLLHNLTNYGSPQMNIRIGGESTDYSVEPTSTTVEPFVELSAATGAQFELSVNLGGDNVQLAVDQATAYANQMPVGSLLGLEIGNEPDLFVKNGYRPTGYSFQDYMGELNTWVENIMPVSNGVKIAGPDDAEHLFGTGANSQTTYLANVQTYLASESSFLSMFTQHEYAASPEDDPAPDFLLTPGAATYGPSLYAPAVQMAQSYGLPFRMGEIGAVSDGGLAGVSNTFASALWAVDLMFNYANVGVVGVNWVASSGNYNGPFSFTTNFANGTHSYTLDIVNPVYSGMLLFAAALGDGAQLLPVTLQTPANLTAWATVPVGRTHAPRITLINKDEVQSGNVSITMPGYSSASVLWLTAPSYTSTSGVTLGGQTMDGSTSGKLQGSKTQPTIEGNNGVFQLSMPITSAALVVFSE